MELTQIFFFLTDPSLYPNTKSLTVMLVHRDQVTDFHLCRSTETLWSTCIMTYNLQGMWGRFEIFCRTSAASP